MGEVKNNNQAQTGRSIKRISLAVLDACQMEVTEGDEKCEYSNWSQEMRLIHLASAL